MSLATALLFFCKDKPTGSCLWLRLAHFKNHLGKWPQSYAVAMPYASQNEDRHYFISPYVNINAR